MGTAYFWKDGEVVVFGGYPYVDNVRKAGLENTYCVDLNDPLPSQRYGLFDPTKCWLSVPLEQFPKDFLTTLLLMGVSL